jgi:hypothetical protein
VNLFTLTDGRKLFYQWDTGRQLIVNNESFEEVHFCNGSSDRSLVCKVFEQNGKRLVNVPNILLQDSRSISVFAFVEDDNGGYTKYRVVYGVRARTKPDNYVYTEEEILQYRTLSNRIDQIEQNGVSDVMIATAVEKYLKENPVETGSKATIGVVELFADKWVGSGNLHSQIVTIEGVTENSQVDLTPDVEQLVVFYEKDLTFVTENDGGVVTVYAIGQKPSNDYTIQVTITEVEL